MFREKATVTTRVLVAASIVLTSFALPHQARAQGLWIDRWELAGLPTSGTAWNNLLSHAQASCGTPNLSSQEDGANVCVMAQALVFARTGDEGMRARVADAIRAIVNSGTYSGGALALGRERGAYPISADLIFLPSYDPTLYWYFRQKLS